MPSFDSSSVPAVALLHAAAPLKAWKRAIKQAQRSPMIRFNVGAAIWNPIQERVVSEGVAHPDISCSKASTSIHAEHHALSNAKHLDLSGCWCILYTINERGGCTYSSRPCVSCAALLYRRNIERVVYAERTLYGWKMISVHPEELVALSPLPTGKFARCQRIPV